MDCCSPDVSKGRLLPTTRARVLLVELVEVPAWMPAHKGLPTPAHDHICRGGHRGRTSVSRRSEGNRLSPPFSYYSDMKKKHQNHQPLRLVPG